MKMKTRIVMEVYHSESTFIYGVIDDFFYSLLGKFFFVKFFTQIFSDFFSWLVQLIPYIHLPAIVEELEGHDQSGATFLISCMGLFAAAGM